MSQSLKEFVKMTPLYPVLRNWFFSRQQKKEFAEWERRGRPNPPPHIVKQKTIREFADKFRLRILVETGTYYGDMVEAMKNHFDQIYSIELSRELYEWSRRRFYGDKRITIIHGNSGIELGNIISFIKIPALFWLDGHYSAGLTARGDKDTPIYEELMHIFQSDQRGHAIIIDDARCFGTEPGYPSMSELIQFIKEMRPYSYIEIENDSIRITMNTDQPKGLNLDLQPKC